MSTTTLPDEIILLIHGTFAAAKESSGAAWWQVDSDPWRKLKSKLHRGLRIHDAEHVFHWNGQNVESERIDAGQRLLARLLELEQQGRAYHLVGHSHGGSVIWEALVDSEAQRMFKRLSEQEGERLELPNLRSWTTLGTPFMTYLPRNTRGLDGRRNWLPLVFGLLLPAFISVSMCLALSFAWTRFGGWIDEVSEFTGQPARWYVAALALFLLLLTVEVQRRLADFSYLVQRHIVHRQAMRQFGGRWLGLWFPDDEAISGLTASTHHENAQMKHAMFAASISEPPPNIWGWVPPIVPRKYFGLNKWGRRPLHEYLFAGVLWPSYELYNAFIAPRLDKLVVRSLLHKLQGNDVPDGVLTFVSAGPIPSPHYPILPEDIGQGILKTANEHAAKLLPQIRQDMCQAALGGLLIPDLFGQLAKAFTGRELFHTLYYLNDDVLDLIRLHVTMASPHCRPFHPATENEKRLCQWIVEFRKTVIEDVIQPIGDRDRAPTSVWRFFGRPVVANYGDLGPPPTAGNGDSLDY